MIDQIESRVWVDNHHAFGDWAKRAIASIVQAFEVLQHQRYDAPWSD